MAGGKETPRQKMIGMMYLVLTALLALNVSKEILDAFIAIDKGLHKTNATLDARSQSSIDALTSAVEKDPAKAT
ncbi:MAG: gliding motility protein GldM, partial [Flavobacteriales bacterium]|nr:gliding motility protein GldM [Flavobacteriales bacterium]